MTEHSNSLREVIIKPNNGLARLGVPQVLEYGHLLRFFILRDLRGRYRPTLLGYSWMLLRPALLCLVYATVFGVLLHVQAPGVPMPLFVFFGIAIYLFFSAAIADTANSLSGSASIISKVYFPRLIVPLTSIATNALHLLATLIIVGALMAFYQVMPPSNVVFFPLFIFAMIVGTFAIGLILAAYSVDRRDVILFLPIAMRILIYTMPAVYPLNLIPEQYRTLYFLNPFAVFMQGLRWSLMDDLPVPSWALFYSAAVLTLALLVGLRVFNRVERTMVDRL